MGSKYETTEKYVLADRPVGFIAWIHITHNACRPLMGHNLHLAKIVIGPSWQAWRGHSTLPEAAFILDIHRASSEPLNWSKVILTLGRWNYGAWDFAVACQCVPERPLAVIVVAIIWYGTIPSSKCAWPMPSSILGQVNHIG
jgi:hypothetical protein